MIWVAQHLQRNTDTMHFDLKSLELFVRVAALGAIGRAGEELGLSSTGASQRLQTLETDLGAKLINRTTRQVSLTPDGTLFLAHAKHVLDAAEEAKSAMSNSAHTVRGILRVTASASFGRTHIVPVLPGFLDRYPNLHVDLHLSDTVVDIVEQGFDVAFRMGNLQPSSLLASKIDDNPVQLVASPAYLARRGVPETPQDLVDHVCLSLGRSRNWTFRAPDHREITVPVSGPLTVNLGDAVGEWVLAGVGIGQAALWHAGADIAAGRLVRVLPEFAVWPETKIWAVRPEGRIMSKRAHVFLNFIKSSIRAKNQEIYGDLLR